MWSPRRVDRGAGRDRFLASAAIERRRRRALRRLRLGGSGLLRLRSGRGVSHGAADGGVLLGPPVERGLLPASRTRDGPPVRRGPGVVDVLPLRVADVSLAHRADGLHAGPLARLERRRVARGRLDPRRQ